jgi:hypothetical protein
MKKRLFYYLLMLALLFGCAKPKREVVDNILSSNSPKMRVKIDPAFKYLGDLRYGIGGYDVYRLSKTKHIGKCICFRDCRRVYDKKSANYHNTETERNMDLER